MAAKKGSRQHRVHEAVVDGVPRRVKFCPACERDRVAEDGAPDSAFFVHSRTNRRTPVFYRVCKECRTRIEGERRASDPEYAERARARERAARERWLASEENREKARVSCLAYYHRRAAEDRESINEVARMAYALRIERREGREVDRSRGTVVDRTAPRVPAAPFRRWLLAYEAAVSPSSREALARDLGLVPRRIRSILDQEHKKVALDVVDRALTSAKEIVRVDGRYVVTIDDLYPAEGLAEFAEAA